MSIAMIFFILFTSMLVIAAVMQALEKSFITHFVTDRPFTIIDIEFPVDANELAKIISGLYRLPQEISTRSTRALKTQLWIDFIYMPALYGSIFLLCLVLSGILD